MNDGERSAFYSVLAEISLSASLSSESNAKSYCEIARTPQLISPARVVCGWNPCDKYHTTWAYLRLEFLSRSRFSVDLFECHLLRLQMGRGTGRMRITVRKTRGRKKLQKNAKGAVGYRYQAAAVEQRQ